MRESGALRQIRRPPTGGAVGLLWRIADPEAIGWAGFWMSTAMVLTFQLLGSISLERADGLLPRMGLLFVAQSLMYLALFLIARPLLSRPRFRGKWPVAMAFFAIGAVVRIVLFSTMTGWIGSPPIQPWAGRILANVGTVVLILSVTAIIRSLTLEYSANRAALTHAQNHLEDLQVRINGKLQAEQERLVESTRASLYETFERAISSPEGTPSDALRQAVDDVVRPLSHRLTEQIPPVPPRKAAPPPLPWRKTLLDAAADFRIYPLWVAGATGWLALTSLSGIYGPRRNLVLALLLTSLIFVAMTALRPLLGRWVGVGRRISTPGIGALLVIPATALSLAALRVLVPSDITLTPIYLGSLFFVPLIAWGASMVGALTRRLSALNDDLFTATHDVAASEIRARTLLWSRQRALARSIHGRVQSAITAAAIRMDFAKFSGEEVSLDEVRQQIGDALTRLDPEGEPQTGIVERMSRIKQTWAGACEVTAQLDSDAVAGLAGHPEAVESISEITQEACSNAVRHAKATQIEIDLDVRVESQARVTIISNGTGAVEPPTRRGLGSAILDDLTIAWGLAVVDDQCVLTAIVPLASDTSPLEADFVGAGSS